MKISEEEYLDNEDSYMGFCTNCNEFTRCETEPDAEDYDCPECEDDSVIGAMTAMMEGYIKIV